MDLGIYVLNFFRYCVGAVLLSNKCNRKLITIFARFPRFALWTVWTRLANGTRRTGGSITSYNRLNLAQLNSNIIFGHIEQLTFPGMPGMPGGPALPENQLRVYHK
jgi:hypothetical protein